ncbi:hypothetical protein B879_00090 [Cecembia lonarensis LW9]|uniref:Uncharacterized protein n=1 Tax=Cecembia lonarensis (strain CCUG 58316 / KCTC 22772 / LW9) TaxID=1225176 RepID=K1L9K7_CECL9|nr:hypothetical protein B879_00090 [Cecembia lonarensis LW9]
MNSYSFLFLKDEKQVKPTLRFIKRKSAMQYLRPIHIFN